MRQFEWWFGGASNAAVAERFAPLLERAIRGELDHWAETARSRLALILVFDQFSRAIHGGTAQAFAQDPKALALALEGIAIGHYGALESPWEKTFFFLPLVHSEELTHVQAAVDLAEQLGAQAQPELRRVLEQSASQARGHRDVIARFGRHPHRNAVRTWRGVNWYTSARRRADHSREQTAGHRLDARRIACLKSSCPRPEPKPPEA